MTRGSQHLRSLTGLRFFAAAAVVLYHAGIQSAPGYDQPYALLRFAYLGVTFFFVLSGFVLVWSARDSDTASGFYRRRFARVWPVHALTFVAAIALAAAALIDQRGPARSSLLNVTLLQAWSNDGEVVYGFNGVSWSLSCELFFYALFPLMLPIARRAGALATVAAGVAWLVVGIVLATSVDQQWILVAFPAYRVGEFVVGMGLALWVLQGGRGATRSLALGATVVSYAGLLVLNRLTAGALSDRPWLVALGILPAVALVLVTFARSDRAGVEGWSTAPWLVRLGQWSFALYMVHELLLRALSPVLEEHLWVAPFAVVACVALSGAVYEWFERPVERRLRGRQRTAVQLEDVRA